MLFRTEINPINSDLQITHNDALVFLGSCFTENIGNKFLRYRFRTLINTHGIIFNPESIVIALNDCLDKKQYTESDLLLFNDHYCSFNHHGKFNRLESNEILKTINDTILSGNAALASASVLFITFGSAYAYVNNQSGVVVANCHKVPQARFSKVLLDHNRIEERMAEVFSKLRVLNPTIKIVLTVSPVRHWKDGAQENQLSKSHLVVACHNLISTIENSYYFPSYEIMMDDLRDYRFYDNDMLHPNTMAIDYIWGKLKNWCIKPETSTFLEKLEPLLRFNEHRILSTTNKDSHESKIDENERKIIDFIDSQKIL